MRSVRTAPLNSLAALRVPQVSALAPAGFSLVASYDLGIGQLQTCRWRDAHSFACAGNASDAVARNRAAQRQLSRMHTKSLLRAASAQIAARADGADGGAE